MVSILDWESNGICAICYSIVAQNQPQTTWK